MTITEKTDCCISGVCDRHNLRNFVSDETANYLTAIKTDEPYDALGALTELAELVAAALRAEVAYVREEGWSWSQVAGPLGITKQAAQQRFGA